VLMGALQYRFAKRLSVLSTFGETESTASTVVLLLFSGEARLEAAIVATMKLRTEVARILNTSSGPT
jgi:hypothetical protein